MTADGETTGLTTATARQRLAAEGVNELARAKGKSAGAILIGQLRSPIVALLVGAAVVSGVVGELVDAIAIAVILVLNAVVGFLQEYRAERAVLALRSMTAPRARVLRDGRTGVVAAAEIVPGDLLVLEAGDVVAADARLVVAHALSTNEASLTGESAPVEKGTTPSPPDAPGARKSGNRHTGSKALA